MVNEGRNLPADSTFPTSPIRTSRKIAQGGLSAAQKRKVQNNRPECLEGRIAAYCSSSSPIGALPHAIQNY